MKTITLIFAAAALTFAQTPAAPAPVAKDAAPAMTPVKKNAKGVKKSSKKVVDTAAKPAVAATPAGK